MPANLKIIKAVIENMTRIYLVAFSEKFQVLNFKAINFIGAFNKKQLKIVVTIKNAGFKIIAL